MIENIVSKTDIRSWLLEKSRDRDIEEVGVYVLSCIDVYALIIRIYYTAGIQEKCTDLPVCEIEKDSKGAIGLEEEVLNAKRADLVNYLSRKYDVITSGEIIETDY